jgi:hypothetical protein
MAEVLLIDPRKIGSKASATAELQLLLLSKIS